METDFSQSKNQYSASVKWHVLQFPLKLAWAVTAHKIQGQTVPKPNMLIADLSKVKQPAQAYVMLSRIQELKQLIMIDGVHQDRIYPSLQAMDELEKMNVRSQNNKNIITSCNMKLVSVDIRTMRKHFEDLVEEPAILECDVILVQQTCLKKDECNMRYSIGNFTSHFNSYGERKDIAIYYSDYFIHESDVSKEDYQISNIKSEKYDILCVYQLSNIQPAKLSERFAQYD